MLGGPVYSGESQEVVARSDRFPFPPGRQAANVSSVLVVDGVAFPVAKDADQRERLYRFPLTYLKLPPVTFEIDPPPPSILPLEPLVLLGNRRDREVPVQFTGGNAPLTPNVFSIRVVGGFEPRLPAPGESQSEYESYPFNREYPRDYSGMARFVKAPADSGNRLTLLLNEQLIRKALNTIHPDGMFPWYGIGLGQRFDERIKIYNARRRSNDGPLKEPPVTVDEFMMDYRDEMQIKLGLAGVTLTGLPVHLLMNIEILDARGERHMHSITVYYDVPFDQARELIKSKVDAFNRRLRKGG